MKRNGCLTSSVGKESWGHFGQHRRQTSLRAPSGFPSVRMGKKTTAGPCPQFGQTGSVGSGVPGAPSDVGLGS
jgi:hypothetical protein